MKRRDPRDTSPAVCRLRMLAPSCGTYTHYRMLQAFANVKDATNDEVIAIMRMDRFGPCTWRRRTDLVKAGLVKVLDKSRVSRAGRRQAVCCIDTRGRKVWDDVRGKPLK